MRKHLRYHKWVVHIDADTIPLDYSLPLSGIVDEGYDVIVQWMDNGQLAAGGVVFKNTAKSWLFMDRWISKGNVTDPPGAGPNADNGDLVELLTEMSGYDCSALSNASISELRRSNFQTFHKCFMDAFKWPLETSHLQLRMAEF